MLKLESTTLDMILQLFLFVVIILGSFILMYFKFDPGILRRTERNAIFFKETDHTASLINGSGVNNIPSLNIISSNAAVNVAHKCSKKPLLYGINGKDSDCQRMCANYTAYALKVGKTDDMIYDNNKLEPGAYCLIGKSPERDTRTTSVIMTINSVMCRSKFPELSIEIIKQVKK